MSEKPQSKPKVLIVGAGLGGITLGILLEKAGVPYKIIEKSTIVWPLGSAISLGPMVFSLLEQIGLAEQFMAQSKPLLSIDVDNGRRELGWTPQPSHFSADPNFFGRFTRFVLSYLPKSIIAHAAVQGIENRP
ncbi:hypothetical protein BGZ81_007872 [Podila clonocystis]|nr:hypothetical protein BGZ81_007872 [Podila clonocystis]